MNLPLSKSIPISLQPIFLARAISPTNHSWLLVVIMPEYHYQNHNLFPAHVPVGQPHILKIVDDQVRSKIWENSLVEPRLCDFIATVLYKLTRCPAAINDFFNPAVKSFRIFSHLIRRAEVVSQSSIMIWRIKKEVVVGLNT
jgi:predicted esterase YcpF (UPF0227 family)